MFIIFGYMHKNIVINLFMPDRVFTFLFVFSGQSIVEIVPMLVN